MPSVFITATLVLGDIPDTVSGLRMRAETPREAVRIIDAGGCAVLPYGAYDSAAEVLRLLGVHEDWVTWSIRVAKGEVPVPDDPFPMPITSPVMRVAKD